MKLNAKCNVCKRRKLFVRKWQFVGEFLPTGSLTTDGDMCKSCHDTTRLLILGKLSFRHYAHNVRARILTKLYDLTKPKETI